MTLVICRRHNHNEVFIDSDTKITDEFGSGLERDLPQHSPLAGLLKTVILHPHVCLSFAGNSIHATEFLKNILSDGIESWDEFKLVQALHKINQETYGECEFILCLSTNRVPKIIEFKNGVVKEDVEISYIGCHEAFTSYQEVFHGSDIENVRERTKFAFRSVIDDPKVTSVGRFHIETHLDHQISGTADSVFIYKMKTELNTGSQVFKVEAGVSTALSFGKAKHGAYGTSYFRSISPRLHGVAIYFPHSDFGVLLCPQVNCERPTILRKCTVQEFLDRIADEYKIPLEGISVRTDGRIGLLRNNVIHPER